jgi:Tol biopolymer transport system component/DNA-binding winged helix-turn-helix (wHTH) protein
MAMRKKSGPIYEFGLFRVDAVQRQITRDGQTVPMQPKVFDTLLVLIENSGQVLEKEEMLRELWPDSFVEESSLSQTIFHLRKALGESGSQYHYIETVPRRGYRFVAEVKKIEAEEVESLAQSNSSYRNGASASQVLSDQAAPPQSALSARAAGLSRRQMLTAGLLVVAAAAIAVAIYAIIRANRPAPPFQKVKITRLTSQGRVLQAAVSPDGKYVAHVIVDSGKQSLWVRQTVMTSNVEIIPPTDVIYRGLTFSRDSNFIYYLAYGKNLGIGSIYQVPVLGGVPVKIIEDVDSPITFSPDGRQIAFVRIYPRERESALMIADSDGSNERALAVKKMPDEISERGPAWSPDGSVIACASHRLDQNGSHINIIGISPSDGSEQLLTPKQWNYVGQIAWLSDGREFVVVGGEKESCVLFEQLWHVTYPAGEVRRIINDLYGYSGVSLSSDSSTLVSIQSLRMSRIFTAENEDENQAAPITSGIGDYMSDRLGMAWTPDGRLVYSSAASGNPDIWIMNADGTNPKQLTMDARGDFLPSVTPDGRYIVFVSERAGPANIWRMNIDGSNPVRLTDGIGEFTPKLFPDGQWVIYYSDNGDNPGVWKVSIEGGAPVRIREGYFGHPTVSPDGKMIAGLRLDQESVRLKITIIGIDDGRLIKTLDETNMVQLSSIRWTPDSRALTYIKTERGVSNLWLHPLDGSPARQLTGFQSDRLFRYAWSANGNHLAFERGTDINDIVLINDVR